MQLTGGSYNAIMLMAPLFLLAAFGLMLGVRRGEAVVETAPAGAS